MQNTNCAFGSGNVWFICIIIAKYQRVTNKYVSELEQFFSSIWFISLQNVWEICMLHWLTNQSHNWGKPLQINWWRKQKFDAALNPYCFFFFPPREPVDEVLQMPPSLLTCGGCQQSIGDRFFLKAIEQYWHEDCLSCDLCGCRLGEVGRRLYYKLGRKLCRRDYLRLVQLVVILWINQLGRLNEVWSTC